MLPLIQFDLESGAKLRHSLDKKTQTYEAAFQTCPMCIKLMSRIRDINEGIVYYCVDRLIKKTIQLSLPYVFYFGTTNEPTSLYTPFIRPSKDPAHILL